MQRVAQRRLLSNLRHSRSTGTRELALPIALLSSKKWSGEDAFRWTPWIARLNSLGYSCMSLDVDVASPSLEAFEQEIATQLRQSPSPFPPLLAAYGYGTILAQAYVSSHPLSALLLVDPPVNIAQAAKEQPVLKLHGVKEFDYEPFFPIALLTSRAKADNLEKHRLRQNYSEDATLLVSSHDDAFSDDGFEMVKRWLSPETLQQLRAYGQLDNASQMPRSDKHNTTQFPQCGEEHLEHVRKVRTHPVAPSAHVRINVE